MTRLDRSCSPRTWGCSPPPPHQGRRSPLLPTHVGVFPAPAQARSAGSSAPHARGGVPAVGPGVPGRGGCSPRTWGCSPAHRRRVHHLRLLPTHVGVFPPSGRSARCTTSAPHARGGVPSPNGGPPSPRSLLPTHVGVFLPRRSIRLAPITAPHARGGVPIGRYTLTTTGRCSPRTWGCSQLLHRGVDLLALLPTHVGVFRRWGLPRCGRWSAPHARGGVPLSTALLKPVSHCSPHVREPFQQRTHDPSAVGSCCPRAWGVLLDLRRRAAALVLRTLGEAERADSGAACPPAGRKLSSDLLFTRQLLRGSGNPVPHRCGRISADVWQGGPRRPHRCGVLLRRPPSPAAGKRNADRGGSRTHPPAGREGERPRSATALSTKGRSGYTRQHRRARAQLNSGSTPLAPAFIRTRGRRAAVGAAGVSCRSGGVWPRCSNPASAGPWSACGWGGGSG